MNDSYTKAACGCPGGWGQPSRLQNLALNAVGVAGGAAWVLSVGLGLARLAGWA